MIRPFALTMLTLAPLAACGPVSLEQAERECYDRAWHAERPRGSVAVGASNRGGFAGVELDVSSDYLAGRDPAQVYQNCVYNRSGGQMPTRPYQDIGRQGRPVRW
ncbi:MAG: hypothetical protein QM656_14880 [Paracoccaceae bacterium]